MGAKFLKGIMVALLSIFLPITILTAGAAENAPSGLDDAFISTALGGYPIETAIQLLLSKNIPIQIIIEEARKAGFSDGEIISALYSSGLPAETAILESMLSHMSSGNVLKNLDAMGVDPVSVLNLLIKNKLDLNRILDTCNYLLSNGYTKAELMKSLMEAGADQDTIFKASSRFNISPATVLEAQEDIHGEPGRFGHVYNRFSLPHPALFAVGVARIHNEVCKDRPVISPCRP